MKPHVVAVLLSGFCALFSVGGLCAGDLEGAGLVRNGSAGDPAPDIRANDSDGPIAIGGDDDLAISIGLDPGSLRGAAADWWIARSGPTGWAWLDISGGGSGWTSGLSVTYQGALVEFPPTAVMSAPGTAPGEYIYYFLVDAEMNGALDPDRWYWDHVVVQVTPSRDDLEAGEPYVDVYDPAKACGGTTLLADLHDAEKPRIIEVNMLGQIVWQYELPDELKQADYVGLDVERLSNDHILFVVSNKGIYEIDRNGAIVWSHLDNHVSHDADRLPNGNTLYVFGNNDGRNDAQMKEVDSSGEVVWSWYANTEFLIDAYKDISRGGWTHANALTRLNNGSTLVSLRNFDLTVEVGTDGLEAWSFDWGDLGVTTVDPHEPEIQSNGNLLVCLQRGSPDQAVEIDRSAGEVVWRYSRAGLRTARDCDRLPNGNTLIVGVLTGGTADRFDDDESVVFEVTPDGEIVWQLKLKEVIVGQSPGVFYKAERICP